MFNVNLAINSYTYYISYSQFDLRIVDEPTCWADDEVLLLVSLDGDPVPEPRDDPGVGVAPGRVAPQLRLAPHLDVRRVRRSLKVFSQNWTKKLIYVLWEDIIISLVQDALV